MYRSMRVTKEVDQEVKHFLLGAVFLTGHYDGTALPADENSADSSAA